MKKYPYILALIILTMGISPSAWGQQLGFDIPEGTNKVRVDFELYNNLIIVPITINGGIELKFILDTGVQYPILTEKFFADLMGLEYTRRITIEGPGMKDSLTALVVQSVQLELPGGVKSGINQSFIVLEKDYLQLRANLGANVYGIIGYDIFSRFIVSINYEERYLELYEPKKFRHKKNYKRLPLQISNTKPYMDITINKNKPDESNIRLMVDTGAGHSLLLNNPDDNSYLPENNIPSIIGRGISGEIYGYLGRVSTISVSKFDLEQPIVSFPMKGDYGSVVKRGSRNGTVGGEFLSRFNVVFDYFGGYIYLKKNKTYSRPFEHDMSGMNISADDGSFDRFKVNWVRPGSPAYEAGIKAGDIILSINGYSYETLKLAGANSLLRLKEGKKITVKIDKDGTSVKKTFKLERFI